MTIIINIMNSECVSYYNGTIFVMSLVEGNMARCISLTSSQDLEGNLFVECTVILLNVLAFPACGDRVYNSCQTAMTFSWRVG